MSTKNVISKNGVWKTAPLNDTPSSGGTVVHAVSNENTLTLDKTWQEIFDGDYVAVIYVSPDAEKRYFAIDSVKTVNNLISGDTEYIVIAYTISQESSGFMRFVASSASDYPSVTVE